MTILEPMLKRDQISILLEFCTICLQSTRKTRILYQANTNFYQLTKYLNIALSYGLIKMIEPNVYLTTEKGRTLLSLFTLES